MALTEAQKQDLYRDGFVVLPQAVSAGRVGAALRAINAALGERGMPPERLEEFRARSYCPELSGEPSIVDLLYDGAWEAAQELIGPGAVRRVGRGQIALRFPVSGEARRPAAHLDGMHSPQNGVEAGTIANFTALVGVFLSDLPGPQSGNFTVWPGTHRLFEGYFREHGAQSLLQGMPAVEMPQPRQLQVHAGDAVLCHYQLAHGVAGNAAPFIRYAVFFRLHHVDHDAVHWECMTDIWREWAGMRDVVATAEPQRPVPSRA